MSDRFILNQQSVAAQKGNASTTDQTESYSVKTSCMLTDVPCQISEDCDPETFNNFNVREYFRELSFIFDYFWHTWRLQSCKESMAKSKGYQG